MIFWTASTICGVSDLNTNNVIITGVPRSGTTLICHLLNKLPNVVALHEPLKLRAINEHGTPEEFCRQVVEVFRIQRNSLLNDGTANSKQVDGQVPDNPWSDKRGGTAITRMLGRIGLGKQRSFRRKQVVKHGVIAVDKPLTDDFTLAIKHPALFTAVIEQAKNVYPCFATMRNPLSVLCSWNSINFPAAEGRSRRAERFDPELSRQLDAIEDRYDRQLHLLNWFFARYRDHLADDRVIRYEDVVESKGRTLERIHPAASELNEPLKSRNVNKLYDLKEMNTLGARLIDSNNACWCFYSKESVEAILKDAHDRTPMRTTKLPVDRKFKSPMGRF